MNQNSAKEYYQVIDGDEDIIWAEVINNQVSRYVWCQCGDKLLRVEAHFTLNASKFFLTGGKLLNLTEVQFQALWNIAK